MPVHLYGQCADMDPILALARERNIPVIEDAAQTIGATYPSRDGVRKAGSMGLAGCLSFFPSKNLGCLGDGGMVVCQDGDFAEKLRLLRNHGGRQRYYHDIVGGNFRLDALQAAVLLVKLPHLQTWHAARRENARYYDQKLAGSSAEPPIAAYGREHHIYNQYVIRVARDRDGLKRHLEAAEIGCEVYYPVPFHMQNCFQHLGYRKGDFPHSERAAEQVLALPVYPEMTDEMQAYVVESIRAFAA
jgi:dTDP-4-amino-4,6-dideoxygalactose transaminase